ncbi:ABC transporter permease [Alteromonas macleodii]|uniref:Permease n=1 Tax=Alteromonas macleodii (strain English Channel 673) TaxID=1004788 RepID=A0AB33A3G1_ALTME|nr:ABC transporter permease [Alteromonas macleodii]AFT76296.1 putative permease [Alteromonas macleodii str. 'English Channel 673']MBL3810578.1 ABC transporter permease [Alteromonas macleodii]MBL3884115.1 ABC transporter permease [Alteromonas macleodii]
MLSTIAIESLKRRKTTAILTLLSITISISLLLCVDIIRTQVKTSFTRTVSGVDLIVGAPSGQLNLLLSSVFNIGTPTKGIEYKSIAALQSNKQVSWLIPLSLGDTHRGFRVVGTTNSFFDHFKYGDMQSLEMAAGSAFTQPLSTVVGADIAKSLGYKVGDKIIISHGLGSVSFNNHDDHPFTISGIVKKTGTPVDKAVYVTLQGLEEAHTGPKHSPTSMLGRKSADKANEHEHEHEHEHDEHTKEHAVYNSEAFTPESVSVVMLGLKHRVTALQLQYQINQSKKEPLMAILPGMALAELWQIMGNVESLLLGLSGLIVICALIGLATMLLATMRERYQEIAVLRTIGAGPFTLLLLIQIEAMLLTIVSAALSLGLVAGLMSALKPWLSSTYGLFLSSPLFGQSSVIIILLILGCTYLVSLFPAVAAYRRGLHAGLNANS